MANTPVPVVKGAVKFKSIRAAYEAARKVNPGLTYQTFYMRQRMGMSVSEAFHKPPRPYRKRDRSADAEPQGWNIVPVDIHMEA